MVIRFEDSFSRNLSNRHSFVIVHFDVPDVKNLIAFKQTFQIRSEIVSENRRCRIAVLMTIHVRYLCRCNSADQVLNAAETCDSVCYA